MQLATSVAATMCVQIMSFHETTANSTLGTGLLCLFFTYYAYFLPIMLCCTAHKI